MSTVTFCVSLVSCRTNTEINYSTGSNNVYPTVVSIGVGGVVQINDPANFPDTYYTITNYCNTSDYENCQACGSFITGTTGTDPNTVYDYAGDLAQYWSDPGFEGNCPKDEPEIPAYVLVNCTSDITYVNPEDIVQSYITALVTSTNLALYVGTVVKIEEYPDYCYKVFGPYNENTGCPCDEVVVTGAYEDCACCLPVPEPGCCEIPKNTQRPVHKYYRITDSDCEIKTNTKFANNYYRLYTSFRYGIKNCCDGVDLEKLWLQKEIADYDKINFGKCTFENPELCMYITGNSTINSQTMEYNGIVNGKWSWLFTFGSNDIFIIYWDNINSRWVCAEQATGLIVFALNQNTDYPIGDADLWYSVNRILRLSSTQGLVTLTIPCECAPEPEIIS